MKCPNAAFSVGIGVDQFRRAFQGGIDFRHFAGNRHKRVGYGFHGLDGTENLFFGERLAFRLDVDKHNVAQFALGEIGDADDGFVAFHTDPFVIFRVFEFSRNVHSFANKPYLAQI